MILPWATSSVGVFMDVSEIRTVRSDFQSCNSKIIETARTGTTNKCIFSVTRGEITGREDGIHYNIVSEGNICQEHPWKEVDEENHIWQKCEVSGEERVLYLKWMYPSTLEVSGNIIGTQLRGTSPFAEIEFNNPVRFITLTLYVEFLYNPGESGNMIEISRINMTQDKITLKIKIM
jgi:hypothetical protein